MKILVTGATGFVGKNLIKSFSKDFDIFIVTRKLESIPIIKPDHQFIFKDNIDQLADFIKNNNIVGVIHFATKYVAEHKPQDIKDLILSNLYFSTAILDAATSGNVNWFLNVGTIWQNYNSKDYSDEYNPVNLYAATKQAFMTISKFYTETTPIRFTTLKLCDTYGPDDTRYKIMDLLKEAASSDAILDMSKGEQLIDIVHISKVIDEIKKLILILNNPKLDFLSEYVVTSGRHISLKDLVIEFEEKNNVKLKINWGKRAYRTREVMKPYRGNTCP